MVYKDRKEITAMIVAFFVAFLFWVYVMGDKNPPQTRVIEDVPVTLINVENIEEANLALIPGQEFMVDLTITGRALDVFKVTAEDFKLQADMSGYLKKGDNNIIPVDIKSEPNGVNVVNKVGYPYSVRVKLDSLLTKSVPVQINVKGNAKEGFGYNQPIVRPSEVLVSGPASYVSQITSVLGQIDISGLGNDVKETIPIKAQDKDGKFVQNVEVEPKNVEVSIPIKPSKEVPVIIKTTGSLPEDKILKSIKPNIDKVLIIGKKEELDRISSIETESIDLSKINKSQTREVALKIPDNIIIGSNLKNISVDISVENRINKALDISLTFLNEDESLSYGYSNSSVSLIIRGAEGIINSIDPKFIRASIDLKGLAEGSHTLPIKITVPDGVEIKEYTPQKITVTITKK